ncbi:hypothetical protein ABT369_25640 [Dactylosporangium sp. NPDC000244]|uniref:hypothetical protein n=1 Tax=Dactylosporangium sp. NPDC000244 TaxID=3154365 RepID=UPI00331C064A
MSDDGELFEASLMLLAAAAVPHVVQRGGPPDPWDAFATGAPLRVEFDSAAAAARFIDLMGSIPEAQCWMRRRVTGIRRRYETFVVDVEGAEPTSVVQRLREEWNRNAGFLFDGRGVAGSELRARAAAVWRSALLTAGPKVTASGLRVRERHRSSVRLLVRAAQVLGVTCRARPARGYQTIQVAGQGVITLLSTIRPATRTVRR